MKNRLFLPAIIIAALLCAAPVFADTMTIDIQAFIDGQDLLVIQGNTLHWNHIAYDPPGTWNGDYPTYVTTTLNGNPVLTSAQWHPWNVDFTLNPSLPNIPMTVDLTVIQARSSLSIYQLPTPSNGETLILNFNDNGPGGAAWYEGNVTINWQSNNVVPEPTSLLLLGSGLAGIALASWRKRK